MRMTVDLSVVAEQAREFPTLDWQRREHGRARARSGAGRPQRPARDARDAQQPAHPRGRCGAGRPTSRRRARKSSSVAALLGHPERGEAMVARARCGARAACRRGAAAGEDRAAGRARRLCRRPAEPRRHACWRKPGCAARRARPPGYGGYVPLEKLLDAAPRRAGDERSSSSAGRTRARFISPIRRLRRSIRRAADRAADRATPCAAGQRWSRRSIISPMLLTTAGRAASYAAAPPIPRPCRRAHRARRSARPGRAAGSAAI